MEKNVSGSLLFRTAFVCDQQLWLVFSISSNFSSLAGVVIARILDDSSVPQVLQIPTSEATFTQYVWAHNAHVGQFLRVRFSSNLNPLSIPWYIITFRPMTWGFCPHLQASELFGLSRQPNPLAVRWSGGVGLAVGEFPGVS